MVLIAVLLRVARCLLRPVLAAQLGSEFYSTYSRNSSTHSYENRSNDSCMNSPPPTRERNPARSKVRALGSFRQRLPRAMLLGLVLGVIGGAFSLPSIHDVRARMGWPLEGHGLRALFALRTTTSPPGDVVLLALDAHSAATLDLPKRPHEWPRYWHACVIDALAARGARQIVIDLHFVAPSTTVGQVPASFRQSKECRLALADLDDGFSADQALALAMERQRRGRLEGASRTLPISLASRLDSLRPSPSGHAAQILRQPLSALLDVAAGVGPFIVPEAFVDPVRGKEIATSQIARGADIVFHAAGVTGLGVIEAAKERGVYAIGVDSNQNPVAPGTMLTSMIKRVDNAIYAAVRQSHEGRFQGGLLEFGLAEDGVGFAVDEHNRDLLSDDVLSRVSALRDSIIAGDILVPSETGRR